MSTSDSNTLTKTCTKCGRELPRAEFSRDSRTSDGLRYECKACNARYRVANTEKIAANAAARYAVYYAENRERLCLKSAAYSAAHPEQRAARLRNYRARQKGNGGSHTAADIQVQFVHQKGRCFWCKKKVGKKYHVDHVTPLSKGGSNGPENLVVACEACNLTKAAKHPMDFAGVMF